MTIFIDNDYKCHVVAAEGLRPIETDFFDGKCPAFIKGYRYIPEGETWINPQGVKCSGISPWRDINLLNEFQAQYEAQLAAADAAYQEGVNTAYD